MKWNKMSEKKPQRNRTIDIYQLSNYERTLDYTYVDGYWTTERAGYMNISDEDIEYWMYSPKLPE